MSVYINGEITATENNVEFDIVDGYPFINHKQVCYCPYNDEYNCTVDLLGPVLVYPGQIYKQISVW